MYYTIRGQPMAPHTASSYTRPATVSTEHGVMYMPAKDEV